MYIDYQILLKENGKTVTPISPLGTEIIVVNKTI